MSALGMGLLSTIGGLVTDLIGGYREKKQAEHERDLKRISSATDLDNTSANDMRHSWKDEWLTLVFTTPVVVIFYGAIFNDPEVIKRMVEGIKAIGELPEWYVLALLGIVAASFGLRTYQRIKAQ